METPVDSEGLGEVVDTLIEAQALLASSIYVDLVNLGLLDAGAAARRLHALSDIAASPLHRHPDVASALGERIRSYADGFDRAHREGGHAPVQLRVVRGGKA
ncbi:hypothetical protein FHS95_003290 [Sphingomonas naasensis]|uniref:Uncharacterized protein n=1 Tax=Sphingomonas naasensis TaxID=1344951 RepID=A0A4S1WEN7_9SPHN|nr:hypothetical protein [Sphingomonas naasensis]NIJ21587.1 hypothetical protein [Sphingomonas naasensis]TGX41471.1 hypothetical protein E5A74_12655 [Sphingomonas naasensis]